MTTLWSNNSKCFISHGIRRNADLWLCWWSLSGTDSIAHRSYNWDYAALNLVLPVATRLKFVRYHDLGALFPGSMRHLQLVRYKEVSLHDTNSLRKAHALENTQASTGQKLMLTQ